MLILLNLMILFTIFLTGVGIVSQCITTILFNKNQLKRFAVATFINLTLFIGTPIIYFVSFRFEFFLLKIEEIPSMGFNLMVGQYYLSNLFNIVMFQIALFVALFIFRTIIYRLIRSASQKEDKKIKKKKSWVSNMNEVIEYARENKDN